MRSQFSISDPRGPQIPHSLSLPIHRQLPYSVPSRVLCTDTQRVSLGMHSCSGCVSRWNVAMPSLPLAGSTWVHLLEMRELVRRLQSSCVVHLLWTRGGRKATEWASPALASSEGMYTGEHHRPWGTGLELL